MSEGARSTSSALPAGTLLGVLLLHLAFMASPLHPSTLDMGGDVHDVAAGQDDPAADDGHCLMEWTRSPEGQVGLSTFGVPPPGSIVALLREVVANRPIAHAHGPPPHADAQALLQVFRL